MDKIEELMELLKQKKSALKELDKAITKAVADADKAEATKNYETARDEIGEIKKQLEVAIAKAEEEAEEKALYARGEKHKATDNADGKKTLVAAKPKDYSERDRAHTKAFMSYMKDGMDMVSGVEMKEFGCTEGSGTFNKAEGGFKLPKSMLIPMMGIKWAKSVGIDDTIIKDVMVSATPELGGHTIPQDFRLPVLDLPVEQSHIIDRATVIPAPTGKVTIPVAQQSATVTGLDGNEFGGMVGQWIDEAGEKPQTETKFDQIEIATHELALSTQISHRLLSRSPIGMQNWIATKGRGTLNNMLDHAFTTGDGNGKPLGFLSTTGIIDVVRESVGDISNKDLVNLKYALSPAHRQNGVYIMEDGVMQILELLEDGQNRPLFKNTIANGPYDRIAGYPYITSTRMPKIADAGSVSFVDLSEYYVAMEADIVMKRSDDFAFTNNVATFAMFCVVGGKLVQPRTCSRIINA